MHVLFLPDYSQGNPYQWELAEALGRCGVKVSLSNGIGHFPLLGAIRTCGKPEVLHLHWTHPFMLSGSGSSWKSLAKSIRFVLELLSLKLRGTKMVWTVHNLVSHEQRNQRIELLFNRICACLYDQMIVHCRFAEEAVIQTYSLPRKFKYKIAIIPHGNFIVTYENSINRKQARDCFGFKEQEIVFLFCGQIRPYKGVFELVAAFQEMNHRRAHLLIAGTPLNEMIQAQLEDICKANHHIHMRLGFIPEDEIQIYMNAADVVVLPFQDVLTSSSVLLAMSFAKAVIAPRLGCIAEVLDNQGAFLYDPDHEDGLLRAMRQALNADLAAIGRHNYERAKQFDWDEIARKTYEVYQRCLG